MELKLDIYKDRFCRKLDRTVTTNDFELSTAICEDVLSMIDGDILNAAATGLSEEGQMSLIVDLIKNAFPFFKDLLKELFEVTDAEVGKTKIADIAKLVKNIIDYSFSTLTTSLGVKEKN